MPAKRPHIPERVSSILPTSYQQTLSVIRKRQVSMASNISAHSTVSEFLENKIRLLNDNIAMVDVYKEGLRQSLDEKPEIEVELNEEEAENRKLESQKELLTVKRQRKTIEDDMADQLQTRTLEDAYACSLVGKVMLVSAKQPKTKFDQQAFRKAVEIYYGSVQPMTTPKRVHCPLTGWAEDSSLLRAAHLVPKSLSSQELSFLFGVWDCVLLSDPRNGLLLHKNLEIALDGGKIVIVPISTGQKEITRWKMLLTDQSLMNQTAYRRGGADVKWRKLDGKELEFLNTNTPARRFIYFRYMITYLDIKKRRDEDAMAWTKQVPDTQVAMWAASGKYLRKSMLRVLARQISDQYLPEAFFTEGTFDETEDCTSRSQGEEEVLGMSLSLNVKNAIKEGKERFQKSDDEEDDDDDEEDDDGNRDDF